MTSVRVVQVAVPAMVAVLLLLLLLPRPAPLTPYLTAPAITREVTVTSANLVLTGDIYVAGHEHPHPELCPSFGAHMQLLILVTSTPSHFARRDAIRMTWGHYGVRSDISIGFVLGIPPGVVKSRVEAEDKLYGDIIMGRFIDKYRNLTLKTLSMLEWVDTYCPRVPRLLKTDDDVFINVPKLLLFINSTKRNNATNTIWGKKKQKDRPYFWKNSKYYVSPHQYSSKVFPDYTAGPAYLMTTDIVKGILAAAPKEPYLNLEDVFITGVLGHKLGIKLKHSVKFYNIKMPQSCAAMRKVIAAHEMSRLGQFNIWRNLLRSKKCNAV